MKETELQEEAHSNQELLEIKKFYEELDEEEKEVIDVTEINAQSIK